MIKKPLPVVDLEGRRDRDYPGRHTSVTVTDGSWAEEWQLHASARDFMLMAFFFATFHLVLLRGCLKKDGSSLTHLE